MNRTIIDVREAYEFANGHVEGAVNIPLTSLLLDETTMKNIPKDSLVILYCRTGNRSGRAAEFLKQRGYSNVKNGINQENVERMLFSA